MPHAKENVGCALRTNNNRNFDKQALRRIRLNEMIGAQCAPYITEYSITIGGYIIGI
jgi:hypothetical protein